MCYKNKEREKAFFDRDHSEDVVVFVFFFFLTLFGG